MSAPRRVESNTVATSNEDAPLVFGVGVPEPSSCEIPKSTQEHRRDNAQGTRDVGSAVILFSACPAVVEGLVCSRTVNQSSHNATFARR